MINNSLFKLSEIPDFHPLAEQYSREEWWREQKKKVPRRLLGGGEVDVWRIILLY